jgi:hypothetical protein
MRFYPMPFSEASFLYLFGTANLAVAKPEERLRSRSNWFPATVICYESQSGIKLRRQALPGQLSPYMPFPALA